MNNFLEKWNSEPKFKTKVKLGAYVIFVIIATIFAFSARSTINYTNESFAENDNKKENISINIPNEYKYAIKIDLNEKSYHYTGTKNIEQETIQKTVDDKMYEYIFKDNRYYKNSIVINNIITKDEVYDIIDYNYLNLETINQYLSIATEKEDKNIVYIKDIILGNESEEYITITIDKNKINIDYTSLMKVFDKTIESSLVEVIIEEIE